MQIENGTEVVEEIEEIEECEHDEISLRLACLEMAIRSTDDLFATGNKRKEIIKTARMFHQFVTGGTRAVTQQEGGKNEQP